MTDLHMYAWGFIHVNVYVSKGGNKGYLVFLISFFTWGIEMSQHFQGPLRSLV